MSDFNLETEADWAKVLELLNIPPRSITLAANRAMFAEAKVLAGKIKEQFVKQTPAKGTWAPLSAWTLRARKFAGFGGRKMLIRTADMFRSVDATKEDAETIFIGVHRTRIASGASGSMAVLANLGAVHEFGATIPIRVSRKMQRYFFAMMNETQRKGTKRKKPKKKRFIKGKSVYGTGSKFAVGATIVVRIPARPFIGPAVEVHGKPEDIMNRVAERVGADLAKRFSGGGGGSE